MPQPSFGFSHRRDWRSAFAALRKLLADGGDTVQVFRIMRALNAGSVRRNYARLLETPGGGRLAFEHVELAQRFGDATFLDRFPAGTVGAAYRDFLAGTGFSAEGLAEISRAEGRDRDAAHPYAWFGRRQRDTHDIWHILTGYRADEQLGEACLVAFSFAQTKGLGWGLIGVGAALKALRQPGGLAYAAAIWDGYRRGARAAWLPAEDYEALLAEPLGDARRRLGIGEPDRYARAQAQAMASGRVPAITPAATALPRA